MNKLGLSQPVCFSLSEVVCVVYVDANLQATSCCILSLIIRLGSNCSVGVAQLFVPSLLPHSDRFGMRCPSRRNHLKTPSTCLLGIAEPFLGDPLVLDSRC